MKYIGSLIFGYITGKYGKISYRWITYIGPGLLYNLYFLA